MVNKFTTSRLAKILLLASAITTQAAGKVLTAPFEADALDYEYYNKKKEDTPNRGGCGPGPVDAVYVTGNPTCTKECAVAFTERGEWLEYQFKSDKDANYNIAAYLSSTSLSNKVLLKLDGKRLGMLKGPGQGLNEYKKKALPDPVFIKGGGTKHKLLVKFLSNNINLCSIDVSLFDDTPNTGTHRFLVAQASPPKNPMCITAVKGTKEFGGLYIKKCDPDGMPANQLWKYDDNQFVSSLDDSMCMTVNDGETVRKNFGVNLADCGNTLTRFIWDAKNTNYIQVKGKKYFCVSHEGSFADNGDYISTEPCADENASNKWIFTDSPKEDLVSVCPRVAKNHAQENLLQVSENPEDKYIGIVVSMSGNGKRVAVFNQLRDDRGIVQVWDDNDGDWSQSFANIQVVGPVNSEWWFFNGDMISLSGDGKYLAVASPLSKEASGEGQVDVYELKDGVASSFGKPIVVTVDSNLHRMAVSMSDDGSRVAVGSNNIVRVYQKSSLSDWELLGEDLKYSGDVSTYGARLSLSPGGDTVAIRITKPNAYGVLLSAAHILRFTSGSWSQMGQELDFGSSSYGYDTSLSYDGNVAAVSTQVFTYDKVNDIWSGVAVRDPRYTNTNSISADGRRVIIGSPSNGRGKVEVFDFDGSKWCKILFQGGAEEGGDFGWTVSLSHDGSRYIVGAPFIEYFHDGLEAYWEVYSIKKRD